MMHRTARYYDEKAWGCPFGCEKANHGRPFCVAAGSRTLPCGRPPPPRAPAVGTPALPVPWGVFAAVLGLVHAGGASAGDGATCLLGPSGRLSVPCDRLRTFLRAGSCGWYTHRGGFQALLGKGRPRKLKLVAFGGSITVGHGTEPSPCYNETQCCPNGWDSQLTRMAEALGIELDITNHAVPASGVASLLYCPRADATDRYDVLVSEFAMNERDSSLLDAWYRTAPHMANHTIVLDVFTQSSYEEKRAGLLGAFKRPTAGVAEALQGKGAIQPLCVSDLGSAAWPHWKAAEPPFRKQDLFPTNPMHGNEEYHNLLALALAWNLFGDSLALGNTYLRQEAQRQRRVPAPAPTPLAADGTDGGGLRRCYGTFGVFDSADHNELPNGTMIDPGPDPRARYVDSANPTLMALPGITVGGGFRYGDAFQRGVRVGHHKRSLFAENPGAVLAFPLPACSTSLTVAFIQHSHPDEGASFMVDVFAGHPTPAVSTTIETFGGGLCVVGKPCTTRHRSRAFQRVADAAVLWPGGGAQALGLARQRQPQPATARITTVAASAKRAPVEITNIIFGGCGPLSVLDLFNRTRSWHPVAVDSGRV